MKVKEMIGALQLHKKNTDSHQLMTVWGEHLDCTKVLEEYPRPQMVRSNYTILNGMWNYAFTSSSRMPEKYDGEILVPFSPESYLSGVHRQLQPKEFLWYQRTFHLQEIPDKQRLILHLGHVTSDAECISMVHRQDFIRADIRHFPWISLPISCRVRTVYRCA